ncbi:zinc carboxypeptidase, partial [Flavobacteriaceae bacterium]|nr:zinc carboxypeptidase [Flavobacteriaceae bacterium]
SDPLTYDITAWSLPYAYGLEASVIDVKVETVSKTSNFKLNEINSNSIGYIFEWSSLKDAEFLTSLLTNDFNVRYSTKKITTNGKKFSPGALILLKRDQNKNDFHSSVIEISNLHERKTHAIISGISDNGPDLGSSDVKLLLNKKVATLAGDGISSLNYGAIWHFFEKQLKYPLT